MTEYARGGANVNAGDEQGRRGRVAEIMQARRGYSSLASDAIEGAGCSHRSDAATELVSEDSVCEAFAGL
ncbi:MAG TPA: hypothetical protein VGI19_01380 [Candidatus Cybelea sp.]